MMFVYRKNNHSSFFVNIYQWFCLLLIFHSINGQQIFTTQVILSNPGSQFVPGNMSAQLLLTTSVDTVKKCLMLCMNNVLCRIYDYEVFALKQCRLFEGDPNKHGQIVSSLSSQSLTGVVYLSVDLFIEYGRACSSFCRQSRYLECGVNMTCVCISHTYWDPSVSMCIPQSPILGASCVQNKSMCREDLNYTCLRYNQCGPLSILSGTTLMDNNTVIGGNWTIGLDRPRGIAVFGTNIDSLIISDLWHHRILGLWNVGTSSQNISVIATEWAPGQALCLPYDLYIDLRHGSDLYVSDYCSGQVILYTNMQTVNPPSRIVAGIFPHVGSTLQNLNVPYGMYVDSHRNVVVVSKDDHRIVFWPPNATNSTVIAGLGVRDNTSMGLNDPSGMVVDEDTWYLYVADANNHRIQRFSLNGTWPCNGTTVAGGNGPGIGSHQLNYPTHVTISKKTKALYIVDYANHRIQRWQQGATQGFTIAGDPNGNPGSSPTQLRNPIGLALNTNETQIYVTDRFNYRVQQFQII